MNLDVENTAQFMPIMQTFRAWTLEMVSECHDADPQQMTDNIRELFNKLEASVLQMSLFPDEDKPTA